MWNFARTQTPSGQRSEIEGPAGRDLDKIFGNLFDPLEPPTPRREYVESPPVTAVVPADAAAQFEAPEELTENAA